MDAARGAESERSCIVLVVVERDSSLVPTRLEQAKARALYSGELHATLVAHSASTAGTGGGILSKTCSPTNEGRRRSSSPANGPVRCMECATLDLGRENPAVRPGKVSGDRAPD